MTYLRRMMIAFDQLGNVFLGGDNPDETISSAVGRKAASGKRWALIAERILDWIFWKLTGERGHCRANIEWDEFNKEIPYG